MHTQISTDNEMAGICFKIIQLGGSGNPGGRWNKIDLITGVQIIQSFFSFWENMLLFFSCPVVSDSLGPHGLQHARLPGPSPSPGVCPSSCLLYQWCHPAISSSDALFFCPWSFPASGAFPMSCLFESDDQNTGASALASVLPVNIQGWFP